MTDTLSLPTDSQERKNTPIARGVLDYFPAAIAAVAQLSKAGNDKHNPGEELHWARGKSMDHADCIARHLIDRGTVDPEDNIRHSVKMAWRALALLQEELEAAGAPLPRGARVVPAPKPVVDDRARVNVRWRCGDCGSSQRYEHTIYRTDEKALEAYHRGFKLACDTSGCEGWVRPE